MIVDGLAPDPRRPGSTRVQVDGRAAWTVPADVIARLALAVGRPVPGPAVEELDRAADEEGALRAALRLLERRAHSRHELERKLCRKGHADSAVTAALARLDSLRLLDDAAFAEAYVAARAGRGRGPARLRRDLRELGVAPAIIEQALGAIEREDVPDPWARTLEQAMRRAAGMAELPRMTRLRRLTAFFARRGFTGEEAREAVDRLAGD